MWERCGDITAWCGSGTLASIGKLAHTVNFLESEDSKT